MRGERRIINGISQDRRIGRSNFLIGPVLEGVDRPAAGSD